MILNSINAHVYVCMRFDINFTLWIIYKANHQREGYNYKNKLNSVIKHFKF